MLDCTLDHFWGDAGNSRSGLEEDLLADVLRPTRVWHELRCYWNPPSLRLEKNFRPTHPHKSTNINNLIEGWVDQDKLESAVNLGELVSPFFPPLWPSGQVRPHFSQLSEADNSPQSGKNSIQKELWSAVYIGVGLFKLFKNEQWLSFPWAHCRAILRMPTDQAAFAFKENAGFEPWLTILWFMYGLNISWDKRRIQPRNCSRSQWTKNNSEPKTPFYRKKAMTVRMVQMWLAGRLTTSSGIMDQEEAGRKILRLKPMFTLKTTAAFKLCLSFRVELSYCIQDGSPLPAVLSWVGQGHRLPDVD